MKQPDCYFMRYRPDLSERRRFLNLFK